MSDNDQDAVEAMTSAVMPHVLSALSSDQRNHILSVIARAILDAIRKGEVPGIVTDDMIQTTKLMVYDSALEEIAALRAEVDKAAAERDRLAGLLCDAGICLLSKDEGRQVSMAAQIDAALAEVGKS